jgi:hypothetical protein
MLVLPVRKEQRDQLGLGQLNLNSVVNSYNESEAFFERPGLAFVLGHCQSVEPENAFRDAADVAELIETYPARFLTAELELVPFIIFEKDNSHGVQDVSCRLAFTVLSLLYDFDYLSIGSQEAGYSMLHQVESMNGALSRRLNGAPFTLDLAAPDKASPEELREAEKAVLKAICKRANGFTYKMGGGFGEVRESRSTLLKCGFEWRPVELAAFIEAAKKGEASSFIATTLELMDGYTGDYGQLLLRAWRLLNAPGIMQCTKTSAHTFHVWKNVLNPDCLPRRGPESFFDFLKLFGGTFPQPKLSVLRPYVDSKKDPGHYMDMLERCSTDGRGATGLDEFYPRVILDAMLEDATLSLMDAFLDGENTLPDEMRNKLCKAMCVDEATLYADLIERIAKAEYSKKYKALVSDQKSDGTIAVVAIIAALKLKKPANATASWPHVTQLKELAKVLKIKVDKVAKRASLLAAIYSYWLALPAERKDALCSPARAAQAQARQPTLPTITPAVAAPAATAADPTAAAVNPAAAVAAAVAAILARTQVAAVAAAQQAAAQAHVEAGEEEEAAEAEAEAEVEATGIRTEDEAMWQAAVAEAALEEEEEDDEAEVLAQAQAEHAAAASLVDSVALVDLKDCMACSRACGERFSHLTMITTCKGFKGQFVCFDREACLARQMSGGGAMERVRKTARVAR